MLKLADVATTVHHTQQLPAEIVKNLKQNFKKPQPTAVHYENKVHIRTNQHYRPDKGNNTWKIKYYRHEKHKTSGFYTPAHIPYETVGDVVLDLRELVDGSLRSLMVAKKRGSRPGWQKFGIKPKDAVEFANRRNTIKTENKDLQEEPKKKKTAKESLENTNGGMDDIKRKLEINRKRVISVKGGKPYSECVREEAAHKTMEIMFHKPPKNVSPTRLTKRFLSKLRERADTKSTVDPTLLSGHASNEDLISLRTSQERRKRNFASKLNCLYQLLCSLYNLRTKDLRTKTPLSKDFLKTLRATIHLDHRGRPIRNIRTTNPQSYSRSGNHRSSTDVSARMPETDNFPVGSPHMFSRPSCMYESASSIFKHGENPSAGTGSTFQRKFGSRFQGMTWDDLLEGKSAYVAPPEAATTTRNAPGRSSFLQNVRNVFKPRRTHGMLQYLPQTTSPTSHQTAEILTLWQQVASSEKHSTKSVSLLHPSAAQLKRPRRKEINTLADIVGENFAQVRARKGQKVKQELEQSRMRERKIFEEKMKAISSASYLERDVKSLRKAEMEVQENFKGNNVKPAEWYKELAKEAEILTLNKDKDIVQLIELCFCFALDDIHTISFSKAKLCLLIQSIPLYDLCSIPMQEGLHFLMTNILHAPLSLLTEWMGHRKIQPLLPKEQKQRQNIIVKE